MENYIKYATVYLKSKITRSENVHIIPLISGNDFLFFEIFIREHFNLIDQFNFIHQTIFIHHTILHIDCGSIEIIEFVIKFNISLFCYGIK